MGRSKTELYHLRDMPINTYQAFQADRDSQLAPVRNAARALSQREPEYHFRTLTREAWPTHGIDTEYSDLRVLFIFRVNASETRTSRELYRAMRLGYFKLFEPPSLTTTTTAEVRHDHS